MAQPKIQQWQADVVGGGPIQYYASFYYEGAGQVIPPDPTSPAQYTTVVLDQTHFDVGGWRYGTADNQFAAPSGLTHMRIQAGIQFKMADDSAIPTNVTLYVAITNPSDPVTDPNIGDTIANYSLRGSGIASSNPTIGNFMNSIYLTTGWRFASGTASGPFGIKVQQNHTVSMLVTRAWITMEGV